MPRQSATKAYANFSGGLITEASVLSYPENAASDIDNFDLVEDGSIQRRPGVMFDSSDTISFPAGLRPLASTATNVFKWRSVNGDPALNIGVVQVGDTLAFYYLKDDEISSTSLAAPTITLVDTLKPSLSTQPLRFATDLQVTSGGGRLYIAGKYIDPFVLTFTAPAVEFDEGTIIQKVLNIKIRDFVIVEEGNKLEGFSLSGEGQQDYMSGAHFYNLANQGWPSDANNFEVVDGVVVSDEANVSNTADPDAGTTKRDPAEYTSQRLSRFPTIAEPFHAFQAGGGSSVAEQVAFSPFLMDNDYLGNTPAGRGRFLKEAFHIRRAATGQNAFNTPPALSPALVAALSYDETVSSDTRPEAVAFYAGRVWYAGLQGGEFTNNVYFSQVIGDDLTKASKCYQDADPTAEDINELVATDGGIFNLEEIGKIYRLEPIGPSLAIIADNGVWVIAGDGEVSSFSADSFSVRKVTDQGAINAESIVFAKDAMYYWGETALYVLSINQTGFLEAIDITSPTIKRFFQRITGFSKRSSFSVFDEGSNRILWFYSDTDDAAFDNFPNKAFNKVLYYDISLNAFGKYSLGTTATTIPVSAINSSIVTTVDIVDLITDGGIQVTDGGEPLTSNTTVFVPDRTSIKIMTVVGDELSGWSYRFSDFTDITNFEDWDVSFSSFLETGFDSLQDIIGKSKKAPFLQAHLTRTETGFIVDPEDVDDQELLLTNESSCLMSYSWDWGSKYTNQFQAYKLLRNYTPNGGGDPFDYDRDVISTRNRLRGRGTALGVRIDSEAGKDLRLLGYGIVFTTRGSL